MSFTANSTRNCEQLAYYKLSSYILSLSLSQTTARQNEQTQAAAKEVVWITRFPKAFNLTA